MRRFVTLAVLLFFTIPFGISIAGCSKKAPTVFCNGTDSGIPVGQVTKITLQPQLTGISLNFTEIGRSVRRQQPIVRARQSRWPTIRTGRSWLTAPRI